MPKLVKLLFITLLLTSLSSCKDKNTSLNIHVISDIHYAPRDLYEYTGKFKESNDTSGTFKQIEYQEEIFDEYINEELLNKPDYILITGDLVYSGSKQTHLAFINKFKALNNDDTKLLVIPGNHDFDASPFTYKNDTYYSDLMISKEDFKEIYYEFGYKDAKSIDDNSLSYSYKLDNNNLLIMLDTTIPGYSDGDISSDTLKWLNNQLDYGNKHNMNIIVSGHHNLLIHNEVFTNGYQINTPGPLIKTLREHNVHLYLSGHMHIQDIYSNDNTLEILTESFTIYPHRYGVIDIDGDDYTYSTSNVDVDKQIDNYSTNGYNFILNNAVNQIITRNKENIRNINDLKQYASIAGKLNINYFMGINDDIELTDKTKQYLSANKYLSSVINNDKDNLNASGKLK